MLHASSCYNKDKTFALKYHLQVICRFLCFPGKFLTYNLENTSFSASRPLRTFTTPPITPYSLFSNPCLMQKFALTTYIFSQAELDFTLEVLDFRCFSYLLLHITLLILPLKPTLSEHSMITQKSSHIIFRNSHLIFMRSSTFIIIIHFRSTKSFPMETRGKQLYEIAMN